MREHPLVPIIRFYLSLAALVVVAVLSPAWGVMFLAAGFGWWPGCGCCAGRCGTSPFFVCNGSHPSSFTVTLTSMASAACPTGNCSNLDAAYVGAFNLDTSVGCVYTFSFDASALLYCSPYNGGSMTLTYDATHTIVDWSLGSTSSGNYAMHWKNTTTLGASPIDCNSIGTVTLPAFSHGSLACDNTGSSASLTN